MTDARTFFYLGLALLALGDADLADEQVIVLEEMASPLAATLTEMCRDARN